MSKRGYISRYMLILKKLKAKKYCSFGELQSFISNQLDYLQIQDDSLNIGFSKRTLQRDIREIRNVFGIDIEYSKQAKGYYISSTLAENTHFTRMAEAFDMFNSLNLSQELTQYIHLEKRKPQGTENIYGLLHAIKNHLQVSFKYHNFWKEETTQRTTEPYALKEFRNRWYLLAVDQKDNHLKSFALDRLNDLEISSKHFLPNADMDIESKYKHSFGIVGANNQEPQEILLSFDPFQAKYIKSLPLHESQEIVSENEDEVKIRLKLCITHDFVMELLSYSQGVKVLQPQELIEQIKSAHQNAFQLYEN